VANKSDVAFIANRIMVCEQCWVKIYPDGKKNEDQPISGKRKCARCWKTVGPEDPYYWADREDLLKHIKGE